MVLDERLKQFATPTQARYLDLVNEHGSVHGAARAAGVDRSTVKEAVASIQKKAREASLVPPGTPGFVTRERSIERDEDGHVKSEWRSEGPDSPFEVGGVGESDARDGTGPYVTKGVSTLYGPDGQQRAQWVKTSLDHQAWLDAVKEAVAAFVSDVAQINIVPAPLDYQNDIIPWIQIGDAHLGLLSHVNEVNENFDLKIAERELCTAIGILLEELPKSERVVINDLGDMTHYENMKGETEASGHKLDYDGRFPKMITVYSRVMRWVIEKALEVSAHVDVIINQGNHSRTNDIWMAELLRVAYGHTGRVHVLNNDNVFIGYRMGNTLVMTHHSDKCKPAKLAGVMTSDFRKDFGETEHHYIDVGHVHHGMVMKEHPSIFIESFNHLAALDKWAHDSGYRNRKSITTILRSRKYGEIGRRVLPIQEIRDRLSKAHKPNAKVAAPRAFVA